MVRLPVEIGSGEQPENGAYNHGRVLVIKEQVAPSSPAVEPMASARVRKAARELSRA